VYEQELAAARKVKAYLESALTKVNRQIMELERKSDENLPSKAHDHSDGGMPLHTPVEHPNKGKSSPVSRTRNRRGAK